MEQRIVPSGFGRSRRVAGKGFSMALAILVALTLVTGVSLAGSSDAPWTIRADANPEMPVAQWYAPAAVSSAPNTHWAIRADANPEMPVAQWYAPAAVSQGCFSC